MADRGYIRFYRSIFSHAVFRKEPFTEREAWTWLIATAAWKPRQQRLGEHLVNLDRGEVVGAVRYLAGEWQWSKGKVERFLERLKNEGMVETNAGTGITVISVCAYNDYQGGDDDLGTGAGRQSGQDRDSAGTAPGQRRDGGGDNRKELKHSNIEKGEEQIGAPGQKADRQPDLLPALIQTAPKKRKAKAGKTKLDPDFLLTDKLRQYARDHGWADPFIEQQFEKWKNHHVGAGTTWVEWDRSWMKWVQNGYDFKRTGGRPAAPSRADSAIEGMFSDLRPEDFHGRSR